MKALHDSCQTLASLLFPEDILEYLKLVSVAEVEGELNTYLEEKILRSKKIAVWLI